MKRDELAALEGKVRVKYQQLGSVLGERARRLWAASEALAIGRGGVGVVARATGLAISTVSVGCTEVKAGGAHSPVVRERRKGAGRKRLEDAQPELIPKLEALVDPATRGDPESPLCWTSKSTGRLAAELKRDGIEVSSTKVGQLLKERGFSLQGTSRTLEGASHPERDAQFQYINERAKECIEKGIPVVSVDTKKKEAVGNYAREGREWQRSGEPVKVKSHEFLNEQSPMAIPYGVYDIGANQGFVNVGMDHDTPAFAARSLARWWELLGSKYYPKATVLYITADAGGSNSRRAHAWKAQLQDFADKAKLSVHVSHFPPGTSKWNKIEHRLFSFITKNWRGRPLVSYETIVSLIAATTTRPGLRVAAELDKGSYPTGTKVLPHVRRSLNIERATFQGEWNYVLRPRQAQHLLALAGADKPPERRSHAERQRRWLALFREQKTSGETNRQFCMKHEIPYYGYIRARRELLGLIRPRRTQQE